MTFFPSNLLRQLCHRTFGTSKRGGWIWGVAQSSGTSGRICPTSQPITLISPKIWFSFKSLCLQGGGGGRQESWGAGADLFEQSGCNESSLGLLEVEGQSERRGTGEWGEIQLQTDCWT